MGKDTNIQAKNSLTEVVSEVGQLSNPLKSQANISANALNNYSQTILRPKHDSDTAEIIEIVRILNNMAPLSMPVYNFNIDEINGERFYKPDGTLLFVRDFDSDVIRDYYYNHSAINPDSSVSRILEHDKNTGRLRVSIEPINRGGSSLRASITIFDEKINKKYTIMQLTEDGIVANISEFSGKGKSFQTLFRDINTLKPVRYMEGKDTPGEGFEMIDCLFGKNGDVARIKRYNNKKDIDITYTDKLKRVSVKIK